MAKRKFILTTSQEAELRVAYHQSKDAGYSKKLLAVRLYGTGHPTQHILDVVGCSRTSLMEWVQRYQRDGVEGLREQRRGGNYYKLSPEEKAALKEQVYHYTPHQLLGNECASSSGAHWTTDDLKLLIYQRYEVIYQSPTSYRALLTEFGLSYQRTEKVFKSKSWLKEADFEEQIEKN